MEVEGTLHSHDTWCQNIQEVNQQPYYNVDDFPPLGNNDQQGNTDGMNQYYDQNEYYYQENQRENQPTTRSEGAPTPIQHHQEPAVQAELTVDPVMEVTETINQVAIPPEIQQNGFKQVLDEVVKNLQNLHQTGSKDYAYAKFSGKAGTINIKDWLNRMEQDHTPDMSDEVKIKNLLKHMDHKVDILSNIINAEFNSYPALTSHLRASFGLKRQPANLSDWGYARRWEGTSVLDWLNTPNGLMLVQQTSIKWDEGKYT